MPSRMPSFRRHRATLSVALCAALVTHVLSASGEETVSAGTGIDAQGVVRDIAYYYQNRGLFNEPKPVDLNFLVLYYNPGWRLLWAQTDTSSVFIRVSNQPMGLETGKRYRLRGTISNDQGIFAPPAGLSELPTPGLPEPIPATDRLHEWSALNNHWISVVAYIDRQEQVSPTHTRLSALVRGRRINIRVTTANQPLADCVGAFVEATGVYAYSASVGAAPATIEIWVPSADRIQIRDTLGGDPRFERAATAIEQLRDTDPATLVRVIGAVHAHEPGRTLVLRDATGQVTLLAGQTNPVPARTLVEAVGYPRVSGPEVRLADAQYRLLPADSVPQFEANDSDRVKLRFVEQIVDLPLDEQEAKPEVALTGLITWAQPGERFFYFQDATGGLKVLVPEGDRTALNFGSIIRVQGRVSPGSFHPAIEATSLGRGADGTPGTPRSLSLDQVLTGTAEGQWVELSGFIRDVRSDDSWTHFALTTPSGEFSARVPLMAKAAQLLNSVVHVRGVCTTIANQRGQAPGIQLLVQSPEDIIVEAALPTDLKSLPIQAIERLHARGTRIELNRWVRIHGVVTYIDPNSHLYVQDGKSSVRVLCRDTSSLRLGGKVDLVGLLGREVGKQVLREARILEAGQEPQSPPEPVAVTDAPDARFDGLVAKLSGTVVSIVDRPDQRRLVLEVNQHLVECIFVEPEKTRFPRSCSPGARVEVTGIYHVELNDYREPRHFALLLRQGEDITVKAAAPWWNLQRVLGLTAALSLLSLLGIGWVALLRRTVRKQTRELIEQRDKEAKLEAELERSSRLESLGMLAGGIAHDFNNMLTVVVGNLTLSLMETPSDSKATEFLTEAEKAALRARQLTNQLLTFARGGDPVRSPHRLGPLVQEAATFALRGSAVSCDFDFAAGVSPAWVDRTQMTQAINNLVLHSSKSMPQGGRIHVTLREIRLFDEEVAKLPSGTYLKLTLSDTGPGIPSEHLGKIFDPYFSTTTPGNGLGLATVHSIVKRHQGHIEATSRLGQGTAFHLWIPTTTQLPEDEIVHANKGPASRRLRVLFMDDDESIRRFAHTVLTRLGHEPTLVPDGTAAVHAYAAAWEANKAFDVVILDLTVVGGMGGKEAIEHLLNIDPQVRAIVSSGYSSDPVMADYTAYGFSGIVSKPYKVADLERNLIDVMERPPTGDNRR